MAASPLDVLLLAGQFEVRGSSTQTLNIAEHMPALRVDTVDGSDDDPGPPVRVHVICHSASRLSTHQLSKLDIEAIRSLGWPILGTLARRYLLWNVIDNPPDVIHIQGLGMHGVGRWLARRTKRPYVMTLHREVTPRDSFRLDRTFGRRVVATSTAIRDSVLAYTRTPESLVTVIRNGVLRPREYAGRNLLDRGHRPVIGTAGPLEAGQGLSHFVRAIPRILASGPAPMASTDSQGDGPDFLIAGAGPEEYALRRLARELGVAGKTTFVSNLYDFSESLQAMDIFCLPAERPGMGVTMLEAMACGVPVIATDVGHVSQVIEDGKTGLVIRPSDTDAIVAAVTSLLRDVPRARRLGKAGQELVRERYPLSHMLEDMLAVYRNAVDQDADNA